MKKFEVCDLDFKVSEGAGMVKHEIFESYLISGKVSRRLGSNFRRDKLLKNFCFSNSVTLTSISLMSFGIVCSIKLQTSI